LHLIRIIQPAAIHSFDLCHVNGNDAGYISFSPYHEEPGTAKLHKVYLQSAFHGYGIGQKMLSYAFERCRKLGFSSVILAVNKQNLKAQKAYERAGFILEKAVCNDIGNGFVMDDYIMRKNFESPQKFPGA
ncbi:MAG: GNAT family N-acetyltransferase, partial [Lentisphaeria bacterium]|nr:GNAT family N-acetyltransferase [Lentisphaeria bacterium]